VRVVIDCDKDLRAKDHEQGEHKSLQLIPADRANPMGETRRDA
jgi:hypothetical protein